jgi:UDP-N-acetylmuramyl pentapeptide phosphotransferase/UDP-N-acetylglucosamine-1-phosphate transferase
VNGRPVLRLLVAGAAARLAYAALTRYEPGDQETWTKTNHRGEPVTLLEGPAVAAAAAAAAAVIPGLAARERLALVLAGTGAGAFGRYDDRAGSGDRRGFRGHLGALARGEVTTGAIKIAGIGAAGLVAAKVLDRHRDRSLLVRAADLGINAGLIAGTANLENLFDLRPGRAIKVSLLASAALAAAGPQARAAFSAPVGAALALLPEDLGERAMLGDSGANALGAMLGVSAAVGLPRPARLAALAAVAGLTAASEKVSFTKVIARTPALNWLDVLGRRPAETPAHNKAAAGGGEAGSQSGQDGARTSAAADSPRPR